MVIWALFMFCISGGRGLDYWVEDYIQGKLFLFCISGGRGLDYWVEDYIQGKNRDFHIF